MTGTKTVLYIQHAGAIGGSAMSLLYTMQGLDQKRFRPVVALLQPTLEMRTLYESAGIETLPWSGIATFEHTTAHHWAAWRPRDWVSALAFAFTIGRTIRSTKKLVRQVNPVIVHLNSAVLAPCAWALCSNHPPVVWHVREHPVRGLVGFRRWLLSRAMRQLPAATIFLSESDRTAWRGGKNSTVVPNFVDFRKFDASLTGTGVRALHGIGPGDPVVLYMGGVMRIKGIFVLLHVLAKLKDSYPALRCLMPGSVLKVDATSRRTRLRALWNRILGPVGLGTIMFTFDKLVAKLGLAEVCVRLPFTGTVAEYYAASDVVLFPAISPHFARPAVEAGAMAKAVVASDLPGVQELVVDQVTGFLVPAGNVDACCNAVSALLSNPSRAAALGRDALTRCRERYSADVQVGRVQEIYDRILCDH